MGYLTGKGGANAYCEICGFQYKNFELKKNWRGLMVCPEDWEPRHPLDFYRTRNDTNKLPFISPNPIEDDIYGMFVARYAPTDVLVNTENQSTFGNRFTCNTDGYFNSIRVFLGLNQSSGISSGLVQNSYQASLWSNAGETLLWSKEVYFNKPGEWNSVPIIPNVAASAATDYTIAVGKIEGVPLSYVTPRPTILPAPPHLEYLSSRHQGDSGLIEYPTIDEAGQMYLINATIRPTT
jgi:hypothetical protein